MSLPPIPSDRPGSSSRFKGVYKNGKKWWAKIRIPSEAGEVYLGTFDSEEEAGIMFARARYKYPVEEPKPCPLDLSEVPMNLPPIPSDTPGSSSRFKGVHKMGRNGRLRSASHPKEERSAWVPSTRRRKQASCMPEPATSTQCRSRLLNLLNHAPWT